MDPQQRLLLELGYAALHGSSQRRVTLMGGDGGVLLGIERPEWALAQPPLARSSVYAVTGDNVSAAAGRVSFVLGLQGPCLSVDTACSSSLVAAHLGYGGLRSGVCSDAIVCGVNLTLSAYSSGMFKRAGMLAEDGRCKVLDSTADGYVRSESCGTLLLRHCESPGDDCSDGLVCSTSVNQDGRSSSLTAPNGPAQQAVMLRASRDAGVPSADVLSLQMHGTGTSLGDPIEIGAACAVLGLSLIHI